MVDAMLADPQRHQKLSATRVADEYNNTAPEMETFESGITLPESLNHSYNLSMSMESGLELLDAWMAEQRVKAFNNALGIHWQGQMPLVSGVWSNNSSNDTSDHEMILGWMTSQNEQERRVIVAPRNQAPVVTANDVALRPIQDKLPLYSQNTIASGCYPQDVTNCVRPLSQTKNPSM